MRARVLILAVAAVAMVSSQGCRLFNKQKRAPKSDEIPPTTQYSNDLPVRPNIEDRPVKTGRLPLVYLLEHPGELRVVDVTGNRILLTTRVGGRTILSLDEEKGISIGGRIVTRGRLDPTHEFAIHLIEPESNMNRNVYQRR